MVAETMKVLLNHFLAVDVTTCWHQTHCLLKSWKILRISSKPQKPFWK